MGEPVALHGIDLHDFKSIKGRCATDSPEDSDWHEPIALADPSLLHAKGANSTLPSARATLYAGVLLSALAGMFGWQCGVSFKEEEPQLLRTVAE